MVFASFKIQAVYSERQRMQLNNKVLQQPACYMSRRLQRQSARQALAAAEFKR